MEKIVVEVAVGGSIRSRPEWLVMATAGVTGLCIVGDSLLYSLLPLEAGNLGIALPLVGVLLSANRLVRLISNTWVGMVFERLGPRIPFIGAALLGLLTTLVYGLRAGFVVFLAARMGWGIAWSGLRQGGFVALWSGSENARGRLMGLWFALVRLGSAASVLVGGYLWDRYGYSTALAVIAGVTMLAVPNAWRIQWPESTLVKIKRPTQVRQGWRMAFETPVQRWLLSAGFMSKVFEAVLMSTVSLYVAKRMDSTASLGALGIGVGTGAGLLLSVRHASNLVFGPLSGAFSDRLGRGRTVLLSGLLMSGGILGAIGLPGLWSLLCLSVVLVAGTGVIVILNASASVVAVQTERPHLFIGVFNTFVDAGSAVGPLLAFLAGEGLGMEKVYLLSCGLFMLAVLRFWRVDAAE